MVAWINITVLRTNEKVTLVWLSHKALKLSFENKIVNVIKKGGVVKVDIYEVDTKIELYVDTFWVGL